MWHEEVKPDNWELGLLVKIPKKGDLTECNNYRCITLTSVVIKIFSMLIKKFMKNSEMNRQDLERAGVALIKYTS